MHNDSGCDRASMTAAGAVAKAGFANGLAECAGIP